jgi:hypothetical protein
VLLVFEPACRQTVQGLVLSGTRTHVLSGTGGSCYREPKQPSNPRKLKENRSLNLDSNRESNLKRRARDVNNIIESGHRIKREAPADYAIPDTAFRNSASTTDDTSDAPSLPLGRKPGGAR